MEVDTAFAVQLVTVLTASIHHFFIDLPLLFCCFFTCYRKVAPLFSFLPPLSYSHSLCLSLCLCVSIFLSFSIFSNFILLSSIALSSSLLDFHESHPLCSLFSHICSYLIFYPSLFSAFLLSSIIFSSLPFLSVLQCMRQVR